ncbi:MAG: hypothetical protein FWG84_07305 [Bacteroidales bacterium]|nr:hypothetical protein [Bacteroidales bacterium]
METAIKLFEERKVRAQWDETAEEWYFSVIDIIEILTDSANPRDYWFKMKQRVTLEDGIELSTICRQLKTELIFTAFAELSTRQIAESEQAKGFFENATAGKRGGTVAKNARQELESETGKSVVTGENFLLPEQNLNSQFSI